MKPARHCGFPHALIGLLSVVLLFAAGCKTGGPGDERNWTFDKLPEGQPPAGWSSFTTKPTGPTAQWQVVQDTRGPSQPRVLALTESGGGPGTINLLIFEAGPAMTDVDLSVRVRSRTGKSAQGGGLVWRWQDANNYYMLGVDTLASQVRVSVVQAGQVRQLAVAGANVKATRWPGIRVVARGQQIVGYLDGQKVLDITDQSIMTPGRVGVWTPADACSAFDDFEIR